MKPDEARELIQGHRAKIDEIDGQLLELVNARATESLAIRVLKPDAGMGLFDAGREEAILERLCAMNEGPLSGGDIRELYATLLAVMKATRGTGDDAGEDSATPAPDPAPAATPAPDSAPADPAQPEGAA